MIFFSIQLRLCKVCTKGLGDSTDSWSLASSGLSATANMTRDVAIRGKVANSKDWWDASIKFMVCGFFVEVEIVLNKN